MNMWRIAIVMCLVGVWCLALATPVSGQSEARRMSRTESVRQDVLDTKPPGQDSTIRSGLSQSRRSLATAIEGANRCESNLREQEAERSQLEELRGAAQRIRGQTGNSATDASPANDGGNADALPESEYETGLANWVRGTNGTAPGRPTPPASSEQAINDKLRTDGVKVDVDGVPFQQRFQSVEHLEAYIEAREHRLNSLEQKNREDLERHQREIRFNQSRLRELDAITRQRMDQRLDDSIPARERNSGITDLIDGVKQQFDPEASSPEEEPLSRIDRIRQAVLEPPLRIGPSLGEKLEQSNRSLMQALGSGAFCQQLLDSIAEARAQDAERRSEIERLREQGEFPNGEGDAPETRLDALDRLRRDAEDSLRRNLERLKDEIVSREAEVANIESQIENVVDMVIDKRIEKFENESWLSDLIDGVRTQFEPSEPLLADEMDAPMSVADWASPSDTRSDVSQMLQALATDQMTPEEYAERIMRHDFQALEEMMDYETRQQATTINQQVTQRERDFQLALQRHQQRVRNQQMYWNQMEQRQWQQHSSNLSPGQIRALQQLGFPLDDALADALSIFGGGGN